MKKRYFLVVALLIFTTSASAGEKVAPSELNKKIQAVLTDFGENVNIGIFVQDAKTGTALYKKDANRYFTPASNQKLFTAFAALHSLGPDFTYQTQLFLDYTKIHKGKLNDNLYLQFSGDPKLTAEQFESLIKSLTEVGIRHIKGKIVVDDTAFDQIAKSPGTSWDDQDFCWGSPISALIINRNCVMATIVPATEPEQPAKLELPSYPQSMQFIKEVVTRPAETKDCAIKVKRSGPTTYTIRGCINASANPHLIEMAINDPRDSMQILLNHFLEKYQITTKGGIEFKKFTIATKPFARQDSPPLKTLVTTMLKESDNSIAEVLFKTMGANYAHEAGSFTNGNNAVRELLAQTLQRNFPKTTLIDGAGASRYNFLTPEQIVSLLQTIFSSPEAADFISSLPISGVDGTLKDRMKEPLILGKIHAKTGSETGVTSLSGYAETNKKRTLIFSIMINGFIDPMSKYKDLEDKLCKVLIESS